ncbi:MAG: CRISPR-associated RAMP protein [Fimbriimonadales bacterium]|nr:MAG: CRISPR-associated RAMP protein [Fimbriimonadales bacterium]
MWDTFENRLRITGELVARTGVRIGMSAETALPTATDLPVIKDAYGRPFIPGSSLRGAVRAYVERIVRTFEPDAGNGKGASNPTKTDEWSIPPEKKQRLASRDDYEKSIYEQSCRVERVFGSAWLASRVRFTDLPLIESHAAVEPELRDSVAIDRDKESVANKYDFEAMPAGVRFQFELIAENLNDEELGLVLLGVRALENGDILIGGFKGRGLGHVVLENPQYDWVDRSQLKDYLIRGQWGMLSEAQRERALETLFHALTGGK